MAGKRKFSESFQENTDVVHNLLKYRATSVNDSSGRPVRAPCQTVTQEELKCMLDNFVVVYEGLDVDDSAIKKPNFSYTELIFLAIMRSPNFCLPIAEIYRYIENRFTFYKSTKKEHWKNAIRHSLSKTKCFTKIGLENQKPRNGVLNRSAFLWTIMPKSLLNFARGDYRPANKLSGTNALRAGFQQLNATGLWEGCVVTLDNRIEAFRAVLNSSPSPAQIFQLQVCNLNNIPQSSQDCQQNVEPRLPFSSPPLQSGKDSILRSQITTPENVNSHGYFCQTPRTTISPSSTATSDSWSPYSNPSDSSGYETIGESSSPEHGANNREDVICPFGSERQQSWESVPELTPAAIFNIPEIPIFTPVDQSVSHTDNADVSLPCANERSAETDHTEACRFTFTHTISLDFLRDTTMSVEDRSILQEFLTF